MLAGHGDGEVLCSTWLWVSAGIAYRGRVTPWMWAGRDEPQLQERMPAGGPEPAVSLEIGLRSDHFTRSGRGVA